MVDERCFPPQIVGAPQWCLWKTEADKKGRPTKVPYRPDGRRAASNNPVTWSSFTEAQAMFARNPSGYAGLGFFFAPDDGICGVDLDVSLDADGKVHAWAAGIVDRFNNTYQAVSMSGKGLHILCKATLQGTGKNFYVPNGPTDPAGKRAQIGVFDRGRFFALTGHSYQGSPLQITEHQRTVEWLLDHIQRRCRPGKDRRPDDAELTDSEMIQRARQAKNGAKFTRLWAGDWQSDYGSQSEADLALCCMLGFWCGPNPLRIDSLFRQSGLVRSKWLEREDYRQSTIEAALRDTTEFYEPRPSRSLKEFSGPSPCTNAPRPEICVGARQLPDITAEALGALQQANEPPDLFVRSGRIVALMRDEHDRYIISDVTEAGLRGRMARSGFYYKLAKSGERVDCSPPLDVVRDLLALTASDWRFPRIETVVETPFLRSNGTICMRPGYDSATGLYYAPAPNLRVPAIPETPVDDDLAAALDLTDSAIGDFPFADAASKANAMATLLSPIVRTAIDGPTPLGLFDAPQPGTGKTLLAEVIAMVATGRSAEVFSAPSEAEEWRKKITTALLASAAVVVIDNVAHRLDSDSLCMALTATTLVDRQFRTFDRLALPVKCTWIATGNNIQLGGDMPRRCYWVRLDAKHSAPFLRRGFRHSNLRAWVSDNRGLLIAALLTLARHWFAIGAPSPRNVEPLGSFESFCHVVGGILESVGVDGFLANREGMLRQSDQEALQCEAFLLTLFESFGAQPFRVSEVVEKMTGSEPDSACPESKPLRESLPDLLADAADRTGGFLQRRMGKFFAEIAGRRFGQTAVYLERADQDRKTKVQLWKISRT